MEINRTASNFYPRSPCGERLNCTSIGRPKRLYFYPRSPCGERPTSGILRFNPCDFYPRSPCGERPCTMTTTISIALFLSTLSLRRATAVTRVARTPTTVISIHALLAESDQVKQTCRAKISISIHALLAESDSDQEASNQTAQQISIHALLAESDECKLMACLMMFGFLSTLSLRRATTALLIQPTRKLDFYPRSPCGERH